MHEVNETQRGNKNLIRIHSYTHTLKIPFLPHSSLIHSIICEHHAFTSFVSAHMKRLFSALILKGVAKKN